MLVTDIMVKSKSGIKKKSFSLYFRGGEIWIEHLDSLNSQEELTKKLEEDILQINKPSTSSYIAVNLDETEVNEEVLQFILQKFTSIKKQLRKVAFRLNLNKEVLQNEINQFVGLLYLYSKLRNSFLS